MSYVSHQRAGLAVGTRRPPWPFLLFLTAVLFVNYHNFSLDHREIYSGNSSQNNFAASVNGSVIDHIALLALGIGAVYSLARHRVRGVFRADGLLGWLVVGFVGWAVISVLWAADLPLTLQRLAGLAIQSVAAVAVARRLLLREIVLWTFFSTFIYLSFGIAVEVLSGAFWPFASGYRFAGSMGPNDQAVECGILLLSAVAAVDLARRWRKLGFFCACLGFIFLILCASRTALTASVLALCVYVGLVKSRRSKAAMACTVAFISCLLLLFMEAGLAPHLKSAILLGRDDPNSVDTFAGRTMIWRDVGPYIREHPVLGYGYGGFWNPSHITAISDEVSLGVPNGHSTYVDYLLTLGGVGLIAYVSILLIGIRRTFRLYKRSQDPAFAFCAAVLVFCAVHGVLESATAERGLVKFLCMVVLVEIAFAFTQRSSWVTAVSSSSTAPRPHDSRTLVEVG